MTDETSADSVEATEDEIEDEGLRIPPIEALPKSDPSRKLAEKTATELSFEEFIMSKKAQQSFDVRKGLSVTMSTLSSDAMQFLGSQLYETHSNEFSAVFDEISRRYHVAACVVSLNDNTIGPDIDQALKKSTEDAERALKSRLDYIGAFPNQVVNLLFAHFLLFSGRVDNMIRGVDIKN